jgi:hypothetical protein
VDGVNGTGSANTTAPFPVSGLNNVGIVNFNPASTAVYIGNRWALTAAHIGPAQNFPGATFTVGGNTFSIDTIHQFTNSDASSADLLAFHLTSTPNLSTLLLSTASPSVGTNIYTMGYGLTRSATMTVGTDGFLEYTESTPNVLRFGTSITSAPPTITGSTVSNNGTTEVINVGSGNTTIFSSTFTASTATGFNTSSSLLSSGDSGGAVFGTNNTLLGINDLLFGPGNQNANTAAYGDQSGFADIATYQGQIASVTGVPEPGTLTFLVGLAPLLMRRRKPSHQFSCR